jgi:hypothetical protein
LFVNHINIEDNNGNVYCKKKNNVIKIDFDICCSCDMFNGSAQGSGVECLWDDERTTKALMRINVPELEFELLNEVTKEKEKSNFSKNEQSFNSLLDRINKQVQTQEK